MKSYQVIFSDHNYMKLEIKYTKKIKRFTNTWGLNKMLNNNQQVMEEIREIKKSSSQTNMEI